MQGKVLQLAGWAVSGILVISSGSAWAANPTNWTTDLVTVTDSNPSAQWTSPTAIDLGYPEYQYTYTIIQADASIVSNWTSVLDQFDPQDLTGNGSFNSLPVSLQDITVNESLLGSTITGTISMSIDSSGYGHLDLTNFSFSGLLDGARAKAQITITGVVPEPASFGLLALAGGFFLTRRRAIRV